MASSDEMNPMLAVREVARLLHIHSNTVRRWSDRGIIRAYHITPMVTEDSGGKTLLASWLSSMPTTKGKTAQAKDKL